MNYRIVTPKLFGERHFPKMELQPLQNISNNIEKGMLKRRRFRKLDIFCSVYFAQLSCLFFRYFLKHYFIFFSFYSSLTKVLKYPIQSKVNGFWESITCPIRLITFSFLILEKLKQLLSNRRRLIVQKEILSAKQEPP